MLKTFLTCKQNSVIFVSNLKKQRKNMKTKHTKGKWKVKPETELSTTKIIHAEQGFIIGSIAHVDEYKANAKLIAAAPDLLLSAMFDACFPITTMEEESKTQEFAIKLGWKKDMPLENFAVIVRKNAIKKATE